MACTNCHDTGDVCGREGDWVSFCHCANGEGRGTEVPVKEAACGSYLHPEHDPVVAWVLVLSGVPIASTTERNEAGGWKAKGGDVRELVERPRSQKVTLTDEQWRSFEESSSPFTRCGCGSTMPCPEHYSWGEALPHMG